MFKDPSGLASTTLKVEDLLIVTVDKNGNVVSSRPGTVADYKKLANNITEKLAANLTNVPNNKNIDLTAGWQYRYESGNPNDPADNPHMHVFQPKGKQSYSQKDDGSPKDKPKGGSGPPNSVIKELKKKTGWDWAANEKIWLNQIIINGPDDSRSYQVIYPNGNEAWISPLPFSTQRPVGWVPSNSYLIDLYFNSFNPSNIQGPPVFVPFPQPVPMPWGYFVPSYA